MVTTTSVEDILNVAGLEEVARRRLELEGGVGEIWDITLPDEQTTVRLCNDDGKIFVYVFVGGRAQICDGEQTFSHALAAPTFVAAALGEIVGTYSS